MEGEQVEVVAGHFPNVAVAGLADEYRPLSVRELRLGAGPADAAENEFRWVLFLRVSWRPEGAGL